VSRHSARQRRSRDSKYFGGGPFDLPPVAVVEEAAAPPPPSRRARRVGIGHAPGDPLPEPRDLAHRVLAVLAMAGAPWTGDATSGGATTGGVAAMLGLKPWTPERQALGGMLTDLREHGFIHFEYNGAFDREARWWMLPRGVEAQAPEGPR
jgi:hypothetical protein